MANTAFDRMGAYLRTVENSEYFPTEPDQSEFSILSVGKFLKGEVGVPIVFNTNNIKDIFSKIGSPVSENAQDWWTLYRGFQYSRPIVTMRVVNSTFKNPAGKLTTNQAGSVSVPFTTVDGQTINHNTTGAMTSADSTNVVVENSQIKDIRIDNLALGANDMGYVIHKYMGKNLDNIKMILLNSKALTDTFTVAEVEYPAVLTATLSITGGAVTAVPVVNAGKGYNSSLLSFAVFQSNGTTPSAGTGLELSYTFNADGSVASIAVVDGGADYEAGAVIKFTVNEGEKTLKKYPQYEYIANLFDYALEASDNILVVLEDDFVVEKFVFNGISTSDKYWGKISSKYGYIAINDTLITTSAFQTEGYAAEYSFLNKGAGVLSDVTFADYLSTLDYYNNNPVANGIMTDGAVPVLFSIDETKLFQQKIISSIVGKFYGNSCLAVPKALEQNLVGKFSITEADLQPLVDYKNSLGYNSDDKGKLAEIAVPSTQRVLDVFNSKYVWIPTSVDWAGGLTRLGNQFHYSPVEERRGIFGFEKLMWDIKSPEIEGFLYKNGINPIINRDGLFVNKGHKTLITKNVAENRMNVSRTMQVFRTTALNLGNQFVAELGLPDTRLKASDVFQTFVDEWKEKGRVVDAKVVVSEDPTDADNNTLKLTLFVKPTKLYDFVEISVNITSQGAVFA